MACWRTCSAWMCALPLTVWQCTLSGLCHIISSPYRLFHSMAGSGTPRRESNASRSLWHGLPLGALPVPLVRGLCKLRFVFSRTTPHECRMEMHIPCASPNSCFGVGLCWEWATEKAWVTHDVPSQSLHETPTLHRRAVNNLSRRLVLCPVCATSAAIRPVYLANSVWAACVIEGGRTVRCARAVRNLGCFPPPVATGPRVLNAAPPMRF